VGLVIAGSGPLRNELEDLSISLGIRDRVEFTGEFERLDQVMSLFDVFVLTSSSESQCMPVTESMAYGKPVVASNFGGIPDFVEDEVTGYLVPIGNEPALVNALKRLLDSPGLRASMGLAGRARYLERYTQKKVTGAIERVYESVLSRRPAAGLRLAYVLESYSPFIVSEILELRNAGAAVTVLDAFKPLPEVDALKESLRRESLFPRTHTRAIAANLACCIRAPLSYPRTAVYLWRKRQSLLMLGLGGYYSGVVRRSRIEHLHGTFGTRTTALAYAVAKLTGVGYSFTTHAYDVFNSNPSLVWKTNNARFMRTISEFNRRYIQETYLGLDSARIHVTYLGVDVRQFAPSLNGVRPADEPRILAIGSLIHQKGHEYLIRACAELAGRSVRFQCDIIGEGPTRELLEALIAQLRLTGRVRLIGSVAWEAVPGRLRDSTLFALPCIDMRGKGEHVDGIPVVLMEAMAAGLPVVSTRLSGIPELIEDGVSGILVRERDEMALADAIATLLNDANLRRAIGQHARARVVERFNIDSNVKALLELFQNNCNGHTS
jgi:glycosyltransferase involved in cell wall biosynthesis